MWAPVRGPRSVPRLLAVWLLAYVLLLQSVLGAAAMAAHTSAAGAAEGLCLSSALDGAALDGAVDGVAHPDDPGPHERAPGVHCAVCPAIGGLPTLPPGPALPRPFAILAAQEPGTGNAHFRAVLPAGEQARPRAPPGA